MSAALQFCVAGLRFSVQCDDTLGVDERWAKFLATDSAPAQRTYCILRLPALLLPQGEATDCGKGTLLIHAPQGDYRCYHNVSDGGLFAVVRECGDTVCIDAALSREPWGTMVQHYFEQLALSHALLQKNCLLIHGAYILYEGQAIVFSAPSGTGKTTQAQLWRDLRGARILNGDRVALGLHNNAISAFGVPTSGSSDDCENFTAPLRALVCLRQAPENRVSRMTARDAVRALVNNSFLPPEYCGDLPAVLDTANMLAQRMAVLELACLPDAGAVTALEQALRGG